MNKKEENFTRVLARFAEQRKRDEDEAEKRTAEIHKKIPETVELDEAMSGLGLKIFGESLKGGSDLEERLCAIREENRALKEKKAKLLEENGFPRDYTSIKYLCPDCKDSGYIGMNICHCLKEALKEERYNSSGLGKLLSKQSFESFSLELYPARAESKDKLSAREVMKRIYEDCLKYADNFSLSSPSLLFVGNTGLGKTHLSSAIAKKALDRGYDVVYDSAPNIINKLAKEQYYSSGEDVGEEYYSADLLIIDDLGTEYHSQASTGAVYNLINTRAIVSGRPTIISTNLSPKELEAIYEKQIISRLFGEFEVKLFEGRDIRMEKIGLRK